MDQLFINNLKLFQAKAGCMYTQQQAESLWRKIKPHLTNEEASLLFTEWDHHLIGEGREKLDSVCNKLLDKYRGKIE